MEKRTRRKHNREIKDRRRQKEQRNEEKDKWIKTKSSVKQRGRRAERHKIKSR